MADHREYRKKTEGYGDQRAPEEGVARSQSNDPLAELARLIDEDPFADFDREREQTISQDGETDVEWEIKPPEALTGESEISPVFREEVEPYADEPSRDDPHGELAVDYLARFSGLSRFEPSEQSEPLPHPIEDEGGAFVSASAAPVTADEADHDAYDPVAALEAHLLGQGASDDGFPASQAEGDLSEGFHDEMQRPEREWEDPTFQRAYSGDDLSPRDLDRDADPFAQEPTEFAQPAYAGPADTDLGSDDGSELASLDDTGPTIPAYADEEPTIRRSKRGLAVLGSLVGLVVLGGAVALGYRGLSGGPEGEPPVIRADSGPTKVMAEDDSEAESAGGSKLVYDRIGGNEPQQEEQLVSREEPVFDVVGRDGQFAGTDPGRDIELRGGAGESGLATDGAESSQPRRVRTVVVRPDGTVVGPTEEATDVAATEPQQVPTAPQAPQASEQEDDAGAAVDENLPAAAEIDTNSDDAGAVTEQAELDDVPASESVETVSTTTSAEDESARPAAGQPLRIIPDGTAGEPGDAGAVADSETQEVARAPEASQADPSLETEDSESDTAATTPFPSGSYVVQVASTRSEGDARNAASRVAQEHGGLLENYQTGIQEADLGDRGIFYRVGVGPMSDRSDATALCERMQSAGLDCFVRQN